MGEVELSPKPFSNFTWAVTCIKGPMNVIMGYCILTAHESHYSLVETSNGQLSIQSSYLALSDHIGKQIPSLNAAFWVHSIHH